MISSQTPSIKRKESAITLVEVLGVVVVVVLLVILLDLLPHNHGRRAARQALDMSNLRQIAVAMLNYANDNGDLLPVHPRDTTNYIQTEDVFISPIFMDSDTVVDRGEFDSSATRYGSYVFVNLGLSLDDTETPSDVILAYTAKDDLEQSSRNVAFADGHVERMEEEKFRAVLPEGVDVDALDGP
jgi:prepilin-type processing-associated H-X9-DG protein